MGLACLYLLLLFLCVVMDSTLLPDWLIEPPYDSVRISCRSVVLFHILMFVLFDLLLMMWFPGVLVCASPHCVCVL